MSLLDLPRVHMTVKARPARMSKAQEKLKAAEAKLDAAVSRHKRAVTRLVASKKTLASAQRVAEQDKLDERAAWDRISAIMQDYKRIKKACEEAK